MKDTEPAETDQGSFRERDRDWSEINQSQKFGLVMNGHFPARPRPHSPIGGQSALVSAVLSGADRSDRGRSGKRSGAC